MQNMKGRKTTRILGQRIKRRIEAYHKVKFAKEDGRIVVSSEIELSQIESKKRVSSALDNLQNLAKVDKRIQVGMKKVSQKKTKKKLAYNEAKNKLEVIEEATED